MIITSLPDNARVWIYQSTRKLSADEAILVNAEIGVFADGWTSHKAPVRGEAHLAYSRFLIFLADEEQVKLGGCSIDSSVRFVKGLEQKFNTSFFDRHHIAYLKGKEVLSCPSTEFEKMLREGEVNDDTIVFNNLVQNKLELITRWQIPYKESWHKNVALANTSFNSIL